MGRGPSTGFVHEVLFCSSDDEMLAATVPFIRSGLDQGQATALSCTPHITALLRDALGDDPHIRYLDRDGIYGTPTGAIAAFQRTVDDLVSTGAGRVRMFGEMSFGRNPDGWGEWARYESIMNRAMAPYPVSSVCIYDTRRIGGSALSSGRFTHPLIAGAAGPVPNPEYVEPGEYLRRSPAAVRDPIQTTAPDLEISDLTDPADLRARLHARLAGPVDTNGQADDFVLAANEVATNAARHGRPPVRARAWATSELWLCTVTDRGDGFDDPFAGYIWPGREEAPTHGMGLWLARRLCDRVDTFSSASDFTVRLMLYPGRD